MTDEQSMYTRMWEDGYKKAEFYEDGNKVTDYES